MSAEKDEKKVIQKVFGSKETPGSANTDCEKTLAEDDENDNSSGNVQNRFERVTVKLTKAKKKRFGLSIIMVHQRIIVYKVEDESLVHKVLKVGDQIVEVNKTKIFDKNKCRQLLIGALHKDGYADLTIIRPKTSDALCTIMEEIDINRRPSLQGLTEHNSNSHNAK